ncbi:MAG TPA: cytochrome c3 family protein [Sphingobacteriaceae bacterium]
MHRYFRLFLIFFVLFALVISLSQCEMVMSEEAGIRGARYADPETCMQCHRNVSASFDKTGHFHTSSVVESAADVMVSKGHDTFQLNEDIRIVLEARGGVMYQVAYERGKEINAQPFNVSFGSGEKAQTYAYWDDRRLFQLPLTYYKAVNGWTNSPGFPIDRIDYSRAIVSRCFECHSSFAATKIVKTGTLSVTEQVVKEAILFGIDCQRCHGPAAAHVDFHQEHPEEKDAREIVRIKNLSRQQRVDMCAVCHSGNDQLTQKSTFSFKPGDTLSHYYYPAFGNAGTTEPDVHGKQYQMLMASACYIKSDMDCSSCHNVHLNEQNSRATFVQRCLNCHNTGMHPDALKLGAALKERCIDCHMPVQQSKLITFQVAGKAGKMPYQLRSHRVGVYPDESKKIKAYISSF